MRRRTWSRWLQNQFTSGPAVPKPPPAPARAEVAPVEKRHVPIPSGGTAEQDQYVADLSTQLDDVLACGKQLNAVIDHQNAQSSRLSAKTESLWESTLRGEMQELRAESRLPVFSVRQTNRSSWTRGSAMSSDKTLSEE